jgi:hypothetical protein
VDADERAGLHQWFLPQLAEAWDASSSGVGNVDDDRYVQWAGYRLGLQVECVSNRYLSGDARLTPAEIEWLRRLGWHDPLGEDLPNFWQSFFDRGDLAAAADALVDAVGVLRGEAPVRQHESPPAPARVLVVVPVMKVDHAAVLTAVDAGLSLQPQAVVIDLLGEALLDESQLDEGLLDDVSGAVPPLPATPVSAVLEAGPYLQYPLLADPGLSFPGGPAADAMSAAAQLLAQLQQLKAAGRSVVLVGPRLLPGLEWLYAASLQAAADAVVFCTPGTHDGGLTADLLTAVLPAVQSTPRLASASAPRVPDALLPALGAVDAVVASRSARLRRDCLAAVLGGLWRIPTGHPPQGSVLDAVVKACLLPLAGRLGALPESLRTPGDVEAAVDLLLAVVSLKQRYPMQRGGAGSVWAQVLTPLCTRLADAGRRRATGMQCATAPLEWLAAHGGDQAGAARLALAGLAEDQARPADGAMQAEPKRSRVPAERSRREPR